MPVHDMGTVSVFSVGGNSMLAVYEDVSYDIEETQVEGSIIARPGETPQGVKLGAKIATNLMSTISAPDRVSHLNLSVATIGGVSYLGLIKSLKFSGSYTQKMRAGVGAWFKRPQNVKKAYSISVVLDCDDAIASAFMIPMHSTTSADRNMILSITLNGIAITLPCRLQKATSGAKRDELQEISLELVGRSPDTGNFPTAPTGTSTLLEKAFNDWKTALAFEYDSAVAAGFTVSGSMIFSSFSFEIADEQLVSTSYAWDSYGTVTAAATS